MLEFPQAEPGRLEIKRFDRIEDPRRRLLIQALATGMMSVLPAAGSAQVFGSRPAAMPAGRSVYRVQGSVSVNGAAANAQTAIRPGDTIQTGRNSELIFIVGDHAMLLRGDSRLVLEAPAKASPSIVVSGLRLLAGKLLSVSHGRSMSVTTTTATIGIRGTGWYAESDPALTYFCTCYGVADVAATADPSSRETVSATQHDRPLYIAANAATGQSVRNAPFINHTDQELMLIESLVGRTPPFVFPKDDYTGPRRDY
jgi:hypothetical protein